MDILEAANSRYRNLSGSNQIFFHSLFEANQAQALDAALRIFGTDWISLAHLEDLRRSISKAYWFIRLPYFFSLNSQGKISELSHDLCEQVDIDKRFVGPEEKLLLSNFIEQLRNLATLPTPWQTLASEIKLLGRNILLTVEQSRWQSDLRSFGEEIAPMTNVTTIGSLGFLAKMQPRDFDALVFLGNPIDVSGAHARLILASGLAQEVHCWIPGRTSFTGKSLDSHIFGSLHPTVELPSFKQKTFMNQSDKEIDGLERVSQKVSVTSISKELELESLGANGSERCFLLRIDEDSVIPIEEDASRVSTLVFDPSNGQIREEQIDWPFDSPGAVVFALIEQGEQDFFWEAAKVEMGDDYMEFALARDSWLRLLSEFVRQRGYGQAERVLEEAGVSTASHLESWLLNERFTRPRADADFRALLGCLIEDEREIEKIMRLTSRFRGELNQVAKVARKLVCDALDSENWATLQSGENLDVLLEEFGDAVYRVGKVIEISKHVVSVPSSQVRRVVAS